MAASFISRMQIAELFQYGNLTYRAYQHIRIGKYLLSIQASDMSFCIPQITAPLTEYDAWEVALFDSAGNWQGHDELRRLGVPEDIVQQFEEGGILPVGKYVSTSDVEFLVAHLEALKETAPVAGGR